jgi:hypothetical protein
LVSTTPANTCGTSKAPPSASGSDAISDTQQAELPNPSKAAGDSSSAAKTESSGDPASPLPAKKTLLASAGPARAGPLTAMASKPMLASLRDRLIHPPRKFLWTGSAVQIPPPKQILARPPGCNLHSAKSTRELLTPFRTNFQIALPFGHTARVC